MRQTAPYGCWPTPLRPESLVERAIGLGPVEVDGDTVVWTESRPNERGRQALVRRDPSGALEELCPEDFSARTLVHEYGGRCAAVLRGTVVCSSMADQRLWRLDGPGDEPVALTPEPAAPLADRYADPVLTPDGRLAVCVRERHGAAVVNDLVAVSLRPEGTPEPPRQLAGGHDFYAAPRLSPDGRRLAWLAWDQPSMPWDATELWVAELHGGGVGEPRLLAGGPGVSISQPRFAPDGSLYYLSDETGFWSLCREGAGTVARQQHDLGGPDWAFGQSTYTFLDDGTVVGAWYEPAGQRLGVLVGGTFEPVATPLTSFASLQGIGRRVVAIAASFVDPPAVVALDPSSGAHETLRASREVPLPAEAIAVPRSFSFTARDAEPAHGLYYPPTSATHEAPTGDKPPLVVLVHGGPTGAARHELSLQVQQWTTRGFAVADVDYRGSTGYGRHYRQRLQGLWGVADADDCADAATHLAAEGLADPARIVIRGSSAGGITVLNGLARHDVFAAGTCLYGVTDLASLATDTHKFEARYLDGLVGPWPEAAATYEDRSPLRHAGDIVRPVIFFQGADDKVVPTSQADAMVAALRAAGVPVEYVVFEGEAHGFRQAGTIVAVAAAELEFYRAVLDLPVAP